MAGYCAANGALWNSRNGSEGQQSRAGPAKPGESRRGWHGSNSTFAGKETVTALVPELQGYSKRDAQLQIAIDRCARLMIKADRGKLQLQELDELLLSEISMRNKSRELGLSPRQVQLMLEKTIRRLQDRPATVTSLKLG
jgi:hypothetical protein